MLRIIFITLFCLSSLQVYGQTKPVMKKPAISSKKAAAKKSEPKKSISPPVIKTAGKFKSHSRKNIKLVYASIPWNRDSTKIDSAYLFIKDSNSENIAKILLDETAPDSSTFAGNFVLDFPIEEGSRPEIYIPPLKLRADQAGLERFYQLLKEQRLNRKPVVLRIDDQGKQLLDVYDTNDQADRARKVYEEELIALGQKPSLTKPVPDEPTLEVAEKTEQAAVLAAMATEAQKREIERIRIEQLERQRNLLKEKELESMSAAEKAKREARAKALGTAAVTSYEEGNYAEAEDNFRLAIDENPLDKSFYFSYAVTLYRNEKFNEALVALKLAPVTEESKSEIAYYAGLIHYRLNEFSPALNNFNEVKTSKNTDLIASAAFYEGLILFTQERYEASKASFEYVLDNSKDPALDREAESYIEQILNAMKYQELAKKKIFVDGTVGLMYDSNVTLASDNVPSQGTALEKASPRALLAGGAAYRFKYNPKHEWSAKFNAVYLYSTEEDVATADAAVFTATAPWLQKGLLGNKGYSWSVVPGYETVLMDLTSTGQTPFMPVILQSPVLNSDITIINNQTWFSSYGFEVRADDSRAVAGADDNADAMKYTLRTSQSSFLDDSKKKVLVGSLGLVLNQAKGKNTSYTRYQGSVTYMAPMKWDALWTANLAVYQLDYPDNPNGRKDFDTALTLGMMKPFREWVTWGLTGSYTKNNSNVDANNYSKYVIMTTASFNFSK